MSFDGYDDVSVLDQRRTTKAGELSDEVPHQAHDDITMYKSKFRKMNSSRDAQVVV